MLVVPAKNLLITTVGVFPLLTTALKPGIILYVPVGKVPRSTVAIPLTVVMGISLFMLFLSMKYSSMFSMEELAILKEAIPLLPFLLIAKETSGNQQKAVWPASHSSPDRV